MRLTTGRKVTAAFAVAMLFLLALGWASYITPRHLIELTAARRRTLQILERLALLQARLNDAETGQRGYLLTGDDAYLKPYVDGQSAIASLLRDLHEMTTDHEEYRRELARLDTLIPQKLGELQRTIDLARSDPRHGHDQALAVVRTGRGKELMDQIRSVVGDLAKNEERARDVLLAATEAASRRLLLVATLISPLALLVVGGSAWLVLRDLAARTRADEALRHLKDSLEERVRQRTAELSAAVEERRKSAEEVRQLNAELEGRVAERTAQLEAANKELEAFSYSVSHDLRAPLRAIDGFSRIVMEDFGPALPDDAKSYLQDVRSNTLRMGQLVDDLLAFSRLSRQSVKKECVSAAQVVKGCVQELTMRDNGRKIDFSLGELPPCEADPSLLKQVWINLLSNAIKYTGKCEMAKIEVGSRSGERPGERIYFVKDNGVGFDMRYASKLFGVFQRLHRIEDYEGTGVGLAIVQRIIHRHGGRVWADAAPDKGATFFFTLEEGSLP